MAEVALTTTRARLVWEEVQQEIPADMVRKALPLHWDVMEVPAEQIREEAEEVKVSLYRLAEPAAQVS